MDSKACLYQFGVLRRSGSDGNPIIWMDVMKSGVVLYGADPGSFVPAITPQILFQALEREVDYLREEISEKPYSEWRNVPSYRAYAVLTLCRILYSFRNGTIVSKQRAVKWAIKHVPSKWHEIILQALESDEGKRRQRISRARIEEFINFIENQMHGTKSIH